MKKVLLLCFILGSINYNIFSQKGKVNAALNLIATEEFEKAIENLEAAQINEKTKDWPKTYYAWGKVYHALYKSKKNDLKAKYDNLLELAYLNFKKASELDTLKKIGDIMDLDVFNLYQDLFSYGVKSFESKKFDQALKAWENALDIRKYSKLTRDVIDSSTIYNCGIAAMNALNYNKAIEYFNKANEINYGGPNTYILLKSCYLSQGDSIKALDVIKKGFEKFQNDQAILIDLINYYLVSKNTKDALIYLDLAIQNDPKNASFYHAKGTLYDKMNEYEKAIELYKKAIELKPDYFDAYYNLGAIYFNKGINLYKEANDELDAKKYEIKKNIADSVYIKAIPLFEKALEIIPDDNFKRDNTLSTLDNLKNLYFRFKTAKPEYEAKYNEVINKIKEIKGE
jgi:tetratricopeptide (TPR) repeat protein